jgi:hypothetical protein
MASSVRLDNTPQAETSSNSLIAKNVLFVRTAVVHTISSNSSSYIRFTSNFTLPPRIVMVYNGTQQVVLFFQPPKQREV